MSFGMPSRPPEVWRADVEATRKRLPPGKVLSVSVVASPEPGWTEEQLAAIVTRDCMIGVARPEAAVLIGAGA